MAPIVSTVIAARLNLQPIGRIRLFRARFPKKSSKFFLARQSGGGYKASYPEGLRVKNGFKALCG